VPIVFVPVRYVFAAVGFREAVEAVSHNEFVVLSIGLEDHQARRQVEEIHDGKFYYYGKAAGTVGGLIVTRTEPKPQTLLQLVPLEEYSSQILEDVQGGPHRITSYL